MTYKGWENRATWQLVNFTSYEEVEDLVKECKAAHMSKEEAVEKVAERLEEDLWEDYDHILKSSNVTEGLLFSFMGMSIQEINFEEVAEGLLEDYNKLEVD